ncbi:MAG: alpha-mannosidase, partial [Sedimentisphaerales bacterium]|nr:alpha-mannosidase [Sedimentisphaerales bacterium]
AGLKYFYTTKLAWNQYNRMPYDSFWWQGIDGTKVLTHLGTTPEAGSGMPVTYNGKAVPEEIYKTWTSCQQKEIHTDLMTAFGYGDGGGGPTREMLENIREMADFPGLPRVQYGRAIDFFAKLEQSAADRLPTWNGELYLEYHRGTYTTQSRNKKANRKSEFMLHDAEWLASQASLMDKTFHYPHEQVREAWKLVCLNQFHDIIPGTSVGEVYIDSLQQYEQIEQIASTVRSEALACIAGAMGGRLILANPTAFDQNRPVLWEHQLAPNESLRDSEGRAALTQPVEEGTLVDPGPIGPLNIISLIVEPGQTEIPQTYLNASSDILENDHLRVRLNKAGDITSLYDKTNDREVLSEGALANEFQAFEDRPIEWDAWDIDMFYDDKMWTAEPAKSIRVVETGPLRATIEVKRRILNSEYTQRIRLNHNSRQLDIETDMDWHEKHILLKTAFPVAIHANEATYEIQWGHVQRPTHRNTSWDWARFEVCAHKWVDLSEGNYGVSLLNDCKYGHDIKDNVIRMTLLRGTTMPDPSADEGRHHFKYSLLPHAGPLDHRILAAAYGLNDPVIVFEPTDSTSEYRRIKPVINVDQKNVVVETVKQAEDSNGLVVRMFDSLRQRGEVTLKTGFRLSAAYKTDLLEHADESLNVQDDSVTFYMRPFEIVTLRLVPDV